jgi:GNAT superfamily N-acetyltransferase
MMNDHAHAAVLPIRRTGLSLPVSVPIKGFDRGYHWHETLRDGSQVVIRPLTRDDAGRERKFLERLTPTSLHYRFLGEVAVTDRLVRELVDVDSTREAAFIALQQDADGRADEQVGVARFCASRDNTACECAVVVSDTWQGRGLGYILMRHLIEVARQSGIRRMISIDSARNQPMRALATDLGFARTVDPAFPAEAVYTLEL